MQSSQAGRPQLNLIRGQPQKPPSYTHWWDMSPEDSSLTHILFDFQRAVCDRPATAFEHSTDTQHLDTRTEDRGGSRSTVSPHQDTLALFTSPINTPSGAFIELLLSWQKHFSHFLWISVLYYRKKKKCRADLGSIHLFLTGFLLLFGFDYLFFCYQQFFILIFSHITQHSIQNITKQNNKHILNISRSNQKGGREGRTTKTQKSLLYIITYIQQKTLPSINGRRPGPTDSRRCTFTWHYLQEATDPICFSTRVV